MSPEQDTPGSGTAGGLPGMLSLSNELADRPAPDMGIPTPQNRALKTARDLQTLRAGPAFDRAKKRTSRDPRIAKGRPRMSNPWTPQPNDEDAEVFFGGDEEAWRGDVHLEDDDSWRAESEIAFGDTEEFTLEEPEGEADEVWSSEDENEWPEWLSDPEYWLYEDRDDGEAAA